MNKDSMGRGPMVPPMTWNAQAHPFFFPLAKQRKKERLQHKRKQKRKTKI